jgi:hypothetical protein
MTRTPKKDEAPMIPFDEALRRVWAAKPKHKTAKKTVKKTRRKKPETR